MMKRRVYAGMITMMDDALAQVVTALQDVNMWDDAIVVFTTDNGGIDVRSNYPLQGSKVFYWEGGINGVGFVSWH
jgi:arylsulfatase A-like enzyme